MEINAATTALGALAQDNRLTLFRHLVRLGPDGSRVSEIRDVLAIPNATLSFHLATLKHAGLIKCERRGRELIYSANFEAMRSLLHYLTDDCCNGHPEICGDLMNSKSQCC